MQVLQQLNHLCMLTESMLAENRHHNSDFIRDVLTEPVVEALVGAFPCTLPPPSQLFAQLSLRHNNVVPYFGHAVSARVISALVKLASTRPPQSSLVFDILCRDIDSTLGGLSTSKRSLQLLLAANSGDESVSAPAVAALAAAELGALEAAGGGGTGAGGDEGSAGGSRGTSVKGEGDLDDLLHEEHPYAAMLMTEPEPVVKSRRRSRGSSFGSKSGGASAWGTAGASSAATANVNVLVVGVLDAIPHRCIMDPSLRSPDPSPDGAITRGPPFSAQLARHTWQYLTATLRLEWLCIMLSHALRAEQRAPQSRVISSGKDTLRRLFAYHRSSLLEVSRFTAQNWLPMVSYSCYFA